MPPCGWSSWPWPSHGCVAVAAPPASVAAIAVAGIVLGGAVLALGADLAVGRRRRWAWELEALVAASALVGVGFRRCWSVPDLA